MKWLLSSALLLALAGPARAAAPAQGAPDPAPEGSRKAPDRRSSAKERHRAKRRDAGKTPPAKSDSAQQSSGDHPCQPVKPCPID